jgi:hypothetical protein
MKMISFFVFFVCVMEHRWNEIDRGKPKYSGKNLSHCHFVHYKSHIDWPGIEPEPSRWEAFDNRLSHDTTGIAIALKFPNNVCI